MLNGVPGRRTGFADSRSAGRARSATFVAVISIAAALGCTTVAEHRKLEERVIDMERARPSTGLREDVADYVADMDALREEIRTLEGRLEVAERLAERAHLEATKVRRELAQLRQSGDGASTSRSSSGEASDSGGVSGGSTGSGGGSSGSQAARKSDSAEVMAYREAYAAWRNDDNAACVDRFRKFLQTYPASAQADDAAFWMADCHYKEGDYKNAVLRFDDVVRNYPTGNKAPDALYRQGESLLKLGPGFREAAKRAFERVIKEYPDSPRASEARRQLEARGAA
jgi:tol-pal system protein YbgF